MPAAGTAALQHEIEQFLYAEADLLDEGRFEEWLDLFAEDAKYFMPLREVRANRADAVRPRGDLSLFEDDKKFLAARVKRLMGPLAHAEDPPSRTRHMISNVRIMSEHDGAVEVRCNFLVYQSRLERTESFFIGRRTDLLRPAPDGWLIASREIVLDQAVLPRTISILF